MLFSRFGFLRCYFASLSLCVCVRVLRTHPSTVHYVLRNLEYTTEVCFVRALCVRVRDVKFVILSLFLSRLIEFSHSLGRARACCSTNTTTCNKTRNSTYIGTSPFANELMIQLAYYSYHQKEPRQSALRFYGFESFDFGIYDGGTYHLGDERNWEKADFLPHSQRAIRSAICGPKNDHLKYCSYVDSNCKKTAGTSMTEFFCERMKRKAADYFFKLEGGQKNG